MIGCARAASGLQVIQNSDGMSLIEVKEQKQGRAHMTLKGKKGRIYFGLLAIVAISVIAGCAAAGAGSGTVPTVVSITPVVDKTAVDITDNIKATFSVAMDPATIVAANFTLANGKTPVTGTVTYDVASKTATFAPSAILSYGTIYTATVTNGVKSDGGLALVTNKVWTFTTAAQGIGPAPVLLGTAGNFAILAKTAISTVPASVITGDVGLSPAAESFMTGFSQVKYTGYSKSPQVIGFMYAADMTPPTPTNMTTAIGDMLTAYNDAAGRVTPNSTDPYSDLGGKTVAPGLYKFTGNLAATTKIHD